MGSSYRSDLNSGGVSEWQQKLEQARNLIQEVIEDVRESSLNWESQDDNLYDDGMLAGVLAAARDLIESELPKPKSKEA